MTKQASFLRLLCVMLLILLSVLNTTLSAQTTISHIVGIGETISSIAQKYKVSESRIIELNPVVAEFIYVGMKLVIPVASDNQFSEKSEDLPVEEKVVHVDVDEELSLRPVKSDSNVEESNSAEQKNANERKGALWEVGYTTTSFKSVKMSGMYGFGFTMLPWELAKNLYMGFHFSPLNFNFGLAPKGYESDVIMLGPAVGYYFTPTILVSVPLDIMCNVMPGVGEDDKLYTSWGLGLSPSLYVGKKFGVYMGPVLTIPFVDNAKVTCGFRAGMYF